MPEAEERRAPDRRRPGAGAAEPRQGGAWASARGGPTAACAAGPRPPRRRWPGGPAGGPASRRRAAGACWCAAAYTGRCRSDGLAGSRTPTHLAVGRSQEHRCAAGTMPSARALRGQLAAGRARAARPARRSACSVSASRLSCAAGGRCRGTRPGPGPCSSSAGPAARRRARSDRTHDHGAPALGRRRAGRREATASADGPVHGPAAPPSAGRRAAPGSWPPQAVAHAARPRARAQASAARSRTEAARGLRATSPASAVLGAAGQQPQVRGRVLGQPTGRSTAVRCVARRRRAPA